MVLPPKQVVGSLNVCTCVLEICVGGVQLGAPAGHPPSPPCLRAALPISHPALLGLTALPRDPLCSGLPLMTCMSGASCPNSRFFLFSHTPFHQPPRFLPWLFTFRAALSMEGKMSDRDPAYTEVTVRNGDKPYVKMVWKQSRKWREERVHERL